MFVGYCLKEWVVHSGATRRSCFVRVWGSGWGRGEERREAETKESVSRMKKGHRIWIPQFQVRVPELSEATALPALMFDITVFLI